MKSERAQQGELIELSLIKIGSVEPKLWIILTKRLEKKKKKEKKKKMLKTKVWTVACFAKATVKISFGFVK